MARTWLASAVTATRMVIARPTAASARAPSAGSRQARITDSAASPNTVATPMPSADKPSPSVAASPMAKSRMNAVKPVASRRPAKMNGLPIRQCWTSPGAISDLEAKGGEDLLVLRGVAGLEPGHHVQDRPALIDDEHCAAGATAAVVEDAVGPRRLQVAVAHQREGQAAQPARELLVLLHAVRAHADDLGAEGADEVVVLLQDRQLAGAKRRVVLLVEGEHDFAGGGELAQAEGALRAGKLEVGRRHPRLRHVKHFGLLLARSDPARAPWPAPSPGCARARPGPPAPIRRGGARSTPRGRRRPRPAAPSPRRCRGPSGTPPVRRAPACAGRTPPRPVAAT